MSETANVKRGRHEEEVERRDAQHRREDRRARGRSAVATTTTPSSTPSRGSSWSESRQQRPATSERRGSDHQHAPSVAAARGERRVGRRGAGAASSALAARRRTRRCSPLLLHERVHQRAAQQARASRGGRGLPTTICADVALAREAQQALGARSRPLRIAVSAPSSSASSKAADEVRRAAAARQRAAGPASRRRPRSTRRAQPRRHAPRRAHQPAALGVRAGCRPASARATGQVAVDPVVAPVVLHLRVDALGGAAAAPARAARSGCPCGRSCSTRALGLLGHVDLALAQPLQQIVGRQVDQLDLVGARRASSRAPSRASTTPVICATTSFRLSTCCTLSVV